MPWSAWCRRQRDHPHLACQPRCGGALSPDAAGSHVRKHPSTAQGGGRAWDALGFAPRQWSRSAPRSGCAVATAVRRGRTAATVTGRAPGCSRWGPGTGAGAASPASRPRSTRPGPATGSWSRRATTTSAPTTRPPGVGRRGQRGRAHPDAGHPPRGLDRNRVIVDGTKPGSKPCDPAVAAQDGGPPDAQNRPSGRNGVEVFEADGRQCREPHRVQLPRRRARRRERDLVQRRRRERPDPHGPVPRRVPVGDVDVLGPRGLGFVRDLRQQRARAGRDRAHLREQHGRLELLRRRVSRLQHRAHRRARAETPRSVTPARTRAAIW